MAGPPPRALRGLAGPALVAAGAFAVQLPTFDRWMSLMDEGHILAFADLLTRGGELYRDATLLPLPGAFYLLALAFEVFEPSIRVARWIGVIEFSLFAGVVFALMRHLVARPLAWITAVLLLVYRVACFPHWHMYSYSTLSLLLLASALLLVVRFLERGERRELVAAGALTGLAVLCKQDYGVAGLVAWNAVLLLRVATAPDRSGARRAVFGWLNAPAAAVGAATAAYFLSQGLFLEMLRQTLLNHLTGIATFEYSSLPPILPLFEQEPIFRDPYGFAVYVPAIVFSVDWDLITSSAFYRETFLWDLGIKTFFYAPYVVALFGALRLVATRAALRDPERRLDSLREAALLAHAAFLLLAFNKPVDWVHLSILTWPFLCLVVLYADRLLRGRRRLAWIAAALAAVPLLAATGYAARLSWKLREKHTEPLRGERAGIFVTELEESVIGPAVDWVRAESEPGDKVAVLPYFPLISFLAERDAPHRSTWIFWPVVDVPDREAEIVAALEAGSADIALYHFTQWVQFPRMDEYAPELFAYLVERYEVERVFSDVGWGYMLAGIRRGGPDEDGVPVLADDASDATLRIESEGGRARGVPAGSRDAYVATALWPFRPVVALRPVAGGGRTVLSVPVDVPANARLRTAISVHPTLWFRFPPSSVTFALEVVDGGGREELFRRTLDPHRDREDRRWFDVEVPLDAWAGERIQIELSTATEIFTGEALEMAGWATPRLVVAPDPR